MTLEAVALAFIALVVVISLIRRLINYSTHWKSRTAHQTPIIHITAPMAVRSSVLGHSVPMGYRLASLYFGSGLIDRTNTLDHGFPVQIMDTVPKLPEPIADQVTETQAIADLSDLCDLRADAIIQKARAESRTIRILWSGGIDSTAATSAILSKIDENTDRVEICYSKQSTKEYKRFLERDLHGHALIKIKAVTDALDTNAIIVTGEHGDQLFGSLKALSLNWELLTGHWSETFPKVLTKQLASSYRSDTLIRYLEPQIASSPIEIVSLWDLLWWLNFSLKWQHVITRIPFSNATSNTDSDTLYNQLARTEHFYRTADFQLWSLNNRRFSVTPGDWATYKYPLKDYILKKTGDKKYHKRKTKEASLQHVMSRSLLTKLMRTCSAIDATFGSFTQANDYSLREAITGVESESRGTTISYERHHENDLWEALGDSGG